MPLVGTAEGVGTMQGVKVGGRRVRGAAGLAILAVLAVAATGCVGSLGSAPAGDDEATGEVSGEVEWWTINLQKNYSDYINGMIDEYEGAHPGVTIKWVDVPGADVTQKFMSALAGGTPPDAVNLTSAQVAEYSDALADMRGLSDDEALTSYAPGLVEALSQDDGKLPAVPWYNGGGLISYYRSSVLNEVGFDVDAPPTTYDEALELAQKIVDETGGYGTNVGTYWALPAFYGVPYFNEDKSKAAFNTPELIDALENLKRRFDSGALAPGTVGPDLRSYDQSVANEQIGFDFAQYATNLAGIENAAPSVYDDLAVSMGPRLPDGKYPMLGMQTFAVPQGSDNKSTAVDWIEFVTNAENQLAFCKIVAIFPSTLKTLEDPLFTSGSGDSPRDEARSLIAGHMNDVEDLTLGTAFDTQLQASLETNFRAVLTGTKSAEQAVADAEAEWNQVLASK